MKKASITCSATLAALIAWPILAQQPNTSDQDKTRTTPSQATPYEGPTSSDRTSSESRRHSDTFLNHAFMDLDKDGRVSKSEFEQAFVKLDSNSDGYISPDEMRQESPHSSGSSSRGSEDSREKNPSQKKDSTKRP